MLLTRTLKAISPPTVLLVLAFSGCSDDETSCVDECATCGDGVVQPGETCDAAILVGQTGACPTSCSDGDACTTDRLENAGSCAAACTTAPITACAGGDGCCPAGCDRANDSDCAACGDGVVQPSETCDNAISAGQTGACPTSCSDGDACTADNLTNAGTCRAACTTAPTTACVDGDGCCPRGCDSTEDSDCTACGNGTVEPGELCDTAIAAGQTGACPTSCSDGNACTTDGLQNGGSCQASCASIPITACAGGDACCPAGCDAAGDSDCSAVCGNGAVEPGELCDTAIGPDQAGACPTSCNDGDACTIEGLQDSGTCQAVCATTPVTACATGDGCCPAGCNANSDGDCAPTCGNAVVESGELCDTGVPANQAGACLVTCADGQVCTTDVVQNSGTCLAACANTPITACSAGDGCCPDGCGESTDGDCAAVCGNGVVDSGELCDVTIAASHPGACPTSCSDGESCTTDVLENSGTCRAACATAPISACSGGDGCCPTGCTAASDSDCPIDLTGTWVSHVTTAGTMSVPLLGSLPANIELILRLALTQSGGHLHAHAQFCRLHTATAGNELVVNFPDPVMALLTDDSDVSLTPPSLGGPVTLPGFNIVTGWNAAGTSVDSDGDGNPGVTLETLITGISFLAYSGLTITLDFPAVTLTDTTTMTGESSFSTTGLVFETSPPGLDGPLSVTPTSPTTPFVSTWLHGDVPCADVLTLFP